MGEPITSWLAGELGSYIDDLRYLSGIDSGSYDKAGIDQVQDWFQEQLAKLGFEVQRLPEETAGDDILAVRRGTGTRKVMLLGHADTVFPLGTAAERPVTIDGDRWWPVTVGNPDDGLDGYVWENGLEQGNPTIRDHIDIGIDNAIERVREKIGV